MCRAKLSGGINTWTQIWSDSQPFLSSLLFINLTAAVIDGRSHHCQVFMYRVECRLPLEGLVEVVEALVSAEFLESAGYLTLYVQ